MKRVVIRTLIVLFSLILLFALLWTVNHFFGKEPDKATGYPVTVNGMTLTGEPETICCFSPGISDSLSKLGAAKKIAFVADADTTEGAEKAVRIGSVYQPDFKALSENTPDLAISLGAPSMTVKQRLALLQIPLLVLEPATTPDALQENIKDICLAIYGDETGASIATQYQARWTEQLTACRKATAQKKIAALWLVGDGLHAATNDTLGGRLLNAMGLENAATGTEYAWRESQLPDGELRLLIIDESIWKQLSPERQSSLKQAVDQIVYFPDECLERQSAALVNLFKTVLPNLT